MNTLKKDLGLIAEGWNAQHAVQSRATLMRGHANAGNTQRAAEYASEIDQLQAAELASLGMAPHECPVGLEEWKLSVLPWAEILIGGGYKRERTFWAPIGATPEQAAAKARITFSKTHYGPEHVTPIYPAGLSLAAE